MKEYKFKINGNEYNVAVNGIEDGKASVTVNGVAYEVEMENQAPARKEISQASPAPQAPAAAPAAAPTAAPTAAARADGAEKTVNSPLPGVIIEVSVKEGQSVKRGQKVAVLEAMKMENDILAPQDGVIVKVLVNKGDSVLEGAGIVTIA